MKLKYYYDSLSFIKHIEKRERYGNEYDKKNERAN